MVETDRDQPPAWVDLAGEPAGPASLTALARADATTLTGSQLVDAIVCSEKAASLILGVQARLLAALAAPFVAGDPMRLAGKLARRSGLFGGDDDDRNVQAMVPEAAIGLAAAEVAAVLRIAPVTASTRVREAVRLTDEFAPVRKALEEGVIDRGKLRTIVEQVQVLPADAVGPVLDQVLPESADRSTSEIREITAQAVITADPQGAADRHEQAAARRDVTVSPGADAMATLKALLPADGAVKIFQISDLLATGTAGVAGDRRGIGARRADALVDIADRLLTDGIVDLTGYLGRPLPDHGTPAPRTRLRCSPHSTTDPAGTIDGDQPGAADLVASRRECAVDENADVPSHSVDRRGHVAESRSVTTDPNPVDSYGSAGHHGDPARVLSRQGRRPHLTVTMSLETLAGVNDLPAGLAGFGSIPADMARTIAESAGTVTAAISDRATGAVIDCGDLVYRPRQALRDRVGVLTDTCQFPSCRQPVWRCDVDHRDPFNHQDPRRGGPTSVRNTGGLCRRHHLLKTHADWQLHVDTQRLVISWTSPTGHSYVRRPRHAAVPQAWIRTAGTAIAERLDDIVRLGDTGATVLTEYQDRPDTDTDADTVPDTDADIVADTGTGTERPRSRSLLEDRIVDAVLREHLAHPALMEYEPEAVDSADDPPPF